MPIGQRAGALENPLVNGLGNDAGVLVAHAPDPEADVVAYTPRSAEHVIISPGPYGRLRFGRPTHLRD